ncbi:MAG: phosphoribosyl-ATP diphosphatase [Dichotomicrobium sp.]
MAEDTLAQLAAIIRQRREASADSSYTRTLLDAGPAYCARKMGEEAVETVIAALHDSDDALKLEAADLLYHLLVLLEVREIPYDDVMSVLADRMATPPPGSGASN